MTTRISTILALLLAGAAIAATPALAAGVTSGNTGPFEVTVNRAAPIALPGAVAPKPIPVISADISRGLFDLDPETALAGLATVTLSSNGDTSETPASDAVRSAFESEMQGYKGN